jgi:DNA-binding beta-propeller fold protein YncE
VPGAGAAVLLGCLGALGGSSGCSAVSTEVPIRRAPAERLVWPGAPERARIEYVGALRSAKDLGRKDGRLARLKSVLFGEDPVEMIKPLDVAKNEAGTLVVADPGVPTVHFFDLEQKRYRRLDDEVAALLDSPVGIAIDDAGRVYLADSVRGKIFVLDEGGRLIGEMGEGLLVRPTGLALGPAHENLYVVDTAACRVVIFDRTGREVGRFGQRGAQVGEFNFPTYIAVGPDGTVQVSDSLNFRVQIFDPSGAPIASFGQPGDAAGDLARPKGVAMDRFGRIYVADAAFENVQIFDPRGALLLAFGAPGTGPGQLYLPGGLFVDSKNTIWVADSFNRRVQIFRLLEGGD